MLDPLWFAGGFVGVILTHYILRRFFYHSLPSPINRYLFHYPDEFGADQAADIAVIERVLVAGLGPDWMASIATLDEQPLPEIVGEQLTEWHDRKTEERLQLLKTIDVAFGLSPYQTGKQNGTGKPSGMDEATRIGILTGFINHCKMLVELSRPFVKPRSRASPIPPIPPSGPGPTSQDEKLPPGGPENSPTPSFLPPPD